MTNICIKWMNLKYRVRKAKCKRESKNTEQEALIRPKSIKTNSLRI